MYRERAFKMATLPHSEHSFRAMRSLFKIVAVMVNIPGSEDEVEGCDVAAMWISVNAAIVLATTWLFDQTKVLITNLSTHHRIAVRYHLSQLVQKSIIYDQLRLQVI